MKRIISILLLSLSSSQAHVPAGNVFGVWEWPSGWLPTMDGDISEWEIIPEWLWITPYTLDNDGNPLFHGTGGGHRGLDGTDSDPSDLSIRVAVAWNDQFDRLYFAQERYDDSFDRDMAEPPGICGGDDAIEIHVDADHSGGPMFYSGDEFPDTAEGRAERIKHNGRRAQQSLWRWPPVGDGPASWNWMWASAATWHDKEPYSCCPDSYDILGEHGTDAELTSEWWSVYFNELVHECPEHSVVAPLSPGQIIGMGIAFCDIDAPDVNGHNTRWSSGGPEAARWYVDSNLLSDWILLDGAMWKTIDVDAADTGVSSRSWGQIKASLGR